jgi:hypothetical protein
MVLDGLVCEGETHTQSYSISVEEAKEHPLGHSPLQQSLSQKAAGKTPMSKRIIGVCMHESLHGGLNNPKPGRTKSSKSTLCLCVT